MVASQVGTLVALGVGVLVLGCGPKFSDGGADAGAGNEDSIPKDALVYWFSADQGISEESGRVARWKDRSGNGADAAQISEDSRPKLTNLDGGSRPAVEFDGDGDFLGMPPLSASFEDGVSLFAVARNHGGDGCMAMLETSNGPEIDDISFDWNQGSLQYEVSFDVAKGQDGAFTPGEPRLLEVVHEPSQTVTLWMNGLSNGVGNFDLPVSVDRNQNFLGRTLYQNCPTWDGEIAEIIMYSRAVESAERQSIEAYLQQKWGCCGT